MATIKIDGKVYDIETFSDDSKAQLASIQYVDAEVSRLQAQVAAFRTARVAYGRALKKTLEDDSDQEQKEVLVEGLGDTIKFD
jgi:prefoldin subunit 5